MEEIDIAKRVLGDKTITAETEFNYDKALVLAKAGFKMKSVDKGFVFGIANEEAFFVAKEGGKTPVHLRTVESISQQSEFTIDSYQ